MLPKSQQADEEISVSKIFWDVLACHSIHILKSLITLIIYFFLFNRANNTTKNSRLTVMEQLIDRSVVGSDPLVLEASMDDRLKFRNPHNFDDLPQVVKDMVIKDHPFNQFRWSVFVFHQPLSHCFVMFFVCRNANRYVLFSR